MSDTKKPSSDKTAAPILTTTSDALRIYQEHQEQAHQRVQDRMPELRLCLSLAAIARLEVEYDGCGDSGQIENVNAFDEHGKPVSLEPHAKLEEAVREFFYDVLEYRYAGWEINDGAYGTFNWDLPEDKLQHEHNARFTDYTTEEHEGL